MRTTLDIDADVMQAAREIARHDRVSLGTVVSGLARSALNRGASTGEATAPSSVRNGVPVLGHRPGEIVTVEHVRDLEDRED